jgi:hypothetical protein
MDVVVVYIMAVVTFIPYFFDGIDMTGAAHALILEMYQAMAPIVEEFVFAVLTNIIGYYCTLCLQFPFMFYLGL